MAHKAVLQDMIPLTAIPKNPNLQETKEFQIRCTDVSVILTITSFLCAWVNWCINHKPFEDTTLYMHRVHLLAEHHKLQRCGEKAGFGGKCLSHSDIENLWKLHIEVIQAGALLYIDTPILVVHNICTHAGKSPGQLSTSATFSTCTQIFCSWSTRTRTVGYTVQ